MHAWLLAPDNFTPPSRTPWGGTAIVDRYKRDLGLAPARVGESWELSAGPEFPSRVAHGPLLSEVVREEPDFALGEEAPRGNTSLLVKLLTYGRTRDEAIVRMKRALHEMVVDGIRTNIPLHQAILEHEDFVMGRLSTRFLERLPYTAATLAKG